ncbi:MAG: hypothetical protein AAFU03_06740 [Bacteroidota bacterium]
MKQAAIYQVQRALILKPDRTVAQIATVTGRSQEEVKAVLDLLEKKEKGKWIKPAMKKISNPTNEKEKTNY